MVWAAVYAKHFGNGQVGSGLSTALATEAVLAMRELEVDRSEEPERDGDDERMLRVMLGAPDCFIYYRPPAGAHGVYIACTHPKLSAWEWCVRCAAFVKPEEAP